jgi:hypothetical protein
LPPGRWLKDTTILTYGHHTAVVTTLFGYPAVTCSAGRARRGYVCPEGWRIVSAHVSEPRT